MATLFGMFPFLQKLFADGGYQGPEFSTALAKVRPHLNVEIVKRSDRAKGFVVLSKRWIVERTLAWLNRCRRLAKDWENRNRKALAFLHCQIASKSDPISLARATPSEGAKTGVAEPHIAEQSRLAPVSWRGEDLGLGYLI